MEPRLVDVAVQHEKIDSAAPGAVPVLLELIRVLQPAPRQRIGRERFGSDRLFAVNPADGSGELVGRRAADPELPGRQIRAFAALHRFERPAIRFEAAQKTVSAAELREAAEVVFRKKFGDRLLEIVEKTRRLFRCADRITEHGRQVWLQRVAAARFELAVKAVRPVLAADLVAVNDAVAQNIEPLRVGQIFFHHAGPVGIEPAARKLVALEPGKRGRSVSLAGRRMADAEQLPGSGRDLPFELSCGIEFSGQVDDRLRRDPGRGGVSGRRRTEAEARAGGVLQFDLRNHRLPGEPHRFQPDVGRADPDRPDPVAETNPGRTRLDRPIAERDVLRTALVVVNAEIECSGLREIHAVRRELDFTAHIEVGLPEFQFRKAKRRQFGKVETQFGGTALLLQRQAEGK